MLSNEKYRNASPEEKLGILGYAHNQGWAKADTWLNSGEVGRDSFGTAGTKYTDAINAAFSGSKMSPVSPAINPPGSSASSESFGPAFANDRTALENLKKLSKKRLNEIKKQENFEFIFKTLRNMIPIFPPSTQSSNKFIVLPPIAQNEPSNSVISGQKADDIPDFNVSGNVKMRGLVGKALGIEDLVS